MNPYPSLAIMICETRARLIFFPFMHEHSLCMEAVVSEPISVLPNGMINPELFTFVCTYIDQLTSTEPAFLTQSDVVFKIHQTSSKHCDEGGSRHTGNIGVSLGWFVGSFLGSRRPASS